MSQYAEYMNSTGIYNVGPFDPKDIEVLRTSSIDAVFLPARRPLQLEQSILSSMPLYFL
jgi:hypothetical protein